MDTINNDLTNLLQQMGVHQESLGITQRIIIIAGIIIIAFVADYFYLKNWYKAQRKAKFYINKCRSASCMQGGLKQASA